MKQLLLLIALGMEAILQPTDVLRRVLHRVQQVLHPPTQTPFQMRSIPVPKLSLTMVKRQMSYALNLLIAGCAQTV
jgi:hypothetical protein